YIEVTHGATVSDIFADRGEDGFRKLERDALRVVADMDNVVIACGGGTPCFFDNMEFMNEAGLTIWLDVSMERLIPRLILGRAKRPLLAGKSDEELLHFVYNALEARRPFYSGAQSVFCSDFLENQEEIDRTVAEFVNRYSLPIKSDCKI
ncbi:MAG: shikimate kinase, partial [Muribaculaceae bacterium]|nr:shikimate kinase [Muribaculaceae bacterium]